MTDIRRSEGSGNQARCFRDDHEPWVQILHARELAHAKHGANSIEAQPAESTHWLPILVEEVGEVANALTYDNRTPGALRAELIDVLAVASAWLAAVDAAVASGLESADRSAAGDGGWSTSIVRGAPAEDDPIEALVQNFASYVGLPSDSAALSVFVARVLEVGGK